MQTLPNEILQLVCEYLVFEDLLAINLVCKSFFQASSSNQVWKPFLPIATNHDTLPKNLSYKQCMLQLLQYRFFQCPAPIQHFFFENDRQTWTTARCAKPLLYGNTYQIAYQVTKLTNTYNSWNIVFGIVPAQFVLQNNVPGFVGDGGYGLGFSSGKFLDSMSKKNRAYLKTNLTMQDVIGIELDWQNPTAVLNFYVNGKCELSHSIKDEEEKWYFAVSIIYEQSVQIVYWNKQVTL